MGLSSMSGGFKNATIRAAGDGITNDKMRGEVIAIVPASYDDTAVYSPRSGGKASPWSQLFAEVLIVTGEYEGLHETKTSIRGNLADQIANQVPDGGMGKTKLLVRVVAGADVMNDESVRWWGIEPLDDDTFAEAEAFVTEYFAPKRTSSTNGSGRAKASSANAGAKGRRAASDDDAPPF